MSRDPTATYQVLTKYSANMVGFFEPVLATVEKSIRDQLKGNAVRIIHITGGFGRSVYLSNQLQQAFPGVDIADTLSEYRSERPVANGESDCR